MQSIIYSFILTLLVFFASNKKDLSSDSDRNNLKQDELMIKFGDLLSEFSRKCSKYISQETFNIENTNKYNDILFEYEPKIIDIYKKKFSVMILKNNLYYSNDIFNNNKCNKMLYTMSKQNAIRFELDVLNFLNGYLTFGINSGYHVIKLDNNYYSNDNRFYIVLKYIDTHNLLDIFNHFNIYNDFNVTMTSSQYVWSLRENLYGYDFNIIERFILRKNTITATDIYQSKITNLRSIPNDSVYNLLDHYVNLDCYQTQGGGG